MLGITINKYIVADPRICHGKPTFKGTRVMVWQVLEMFSRGETAADIMRAFPNITSAHLKAAFEYASTLTSQNYVIFNTAETFAR